MKKAKISETVTQKKKETVKMLDYEEKLLNPYNYTHSLIEVSLDPFVIINATGKISDLNKATENATGLSRNLLIGTDFSDYFTEPENAFAAARDISNFKEVYYKTNF
jgi:PAS domain-containing protein